MSHHISKKSRSSRRAVTSFVTDDAENRTVVPRLCRITDFCLWATFVAVTLCFGGRAAVGQLILVAGASLTAFVWLLHLLTSSEREYAWTGSEWLWCAGILVGVAQVVPLSQDLLLMISPQIREILPMWFDPDTASLFPGGWRQLSLAPEATRSGLATFVAYAMLFLVLTQRVRTSRDVERMLYGVSLAAVVMAVFASVQWLAGNGKYYWFYEHPYMTTEGTPHGSFTNHNHLAQFLALGIGPLIWWTVRLGQSSNDSGFGQSTGSSSRFGFAILFLGLGATVLTLLCTTSRGGLLAFAAAVPVSLILLSRIGLLSTRFVIGLCGAGIVTAAVFFCIGYESLVRRVDRTVDQGSKSFGRLEVWQANLKVTSDFPVFGTGVGTHEEAHQLHLDMIDGDSRVFTHAESSYLQVASETGLAGLFVMLLFVFTSVRWCLSGLRHSDTDVSAPAAAILASLAANLAHAAGDFFWYTPSCMLLLAFQLAGAFRLSRMEREENGRKNWSLRLPRIIPLAGACAVLVTAAWMSDQKLPAALAEADYVRYLNLTFQEQPQEEDELLGLEDERRQAIIRAARRDPASSRLQEYAALAYLSLFDARQLASENPLNSSQVREVVNASEFESQHALQDWLQRAIGRNTKLLQLSRKCLVRSLQASPLRANAYVKLAELSYLRNGDKAHERRLLNQAVKLRPNDPQLQFSVGKNLLLDGDMDGAIVYWRAAFHRSRRVRDQIINVLAEHVTPEFFVDSFQPEWSSLRPLAEAFVRAGRTEEAGVIWQKCVEGGAEQLRLHPNAAARESVSLTLRDAYFALDEPERAIRVLAAAQRQLPYSLAIRSRLGWDLFTAGRHAEAAEHLQWCAARMPGDQGLQNAASVAIKARLKSVAAGSSSDRS